MEPTAAATTRLELADDWDVVNERFIAEGWSDGLPIVPPTEDRVRRFVPRADEPLGGRGRLAPGDGGRHRREDRRQRGHGRLPPEYMPVLCAALEAVADPVFNVHTIQVRATRSVS